MIKLSYAQVLELTKKADSMPTAQDFATSRSARGAKPLGSGKQVGSTKALGNIAKKPVQPAPMMPKAVSPAPEYNPANAVRVYEPPAPVPAAPAVQPAAVSAKRTRQENKAYSDKMLASVRQDISNESKPKAAPYSSGMSAGGRSLNMSTGQYERTGAPSTPNYGARMVATQNAQNTRQAQSNNQAQLAMNQAKVNSVKGPAVSPQSQRYMDRVAASKRPGFIQPSDFKGGVSTQKAMATANNRWDARNPQATNNKMIASNSKKLR